MKVLVVGGGGREHALAWRCAQSTRVETVFVAPGNAGTQTETKCVNVDIAADDQGGLAEFAARENLDLTIVGPEAPLVAGISDHFARRGLRCFGPSAAASRLEGSKAYAKAFLGRHRIPTARHAVFDDIDAARLYIDEQGAPVVVKADGLAAGKGVIVAHSVAEAHGAVEDMLGHKAFGDAGARVVVEECLAGEEVSFIAIVDGDSIAPLATSQDHKARDNGDKGPNTGGMGAYSPAPLVDSTLHERIMREVMIPAVRGLAEEDARYTGFLYAGLMIAPDGTPNVLEFNCRLGDPETQPIMMRLGSDLTTLCEAALDGELDSVAVEWDPRPCVGVVMAAGGYPGEYTTGDVISGLEESRTDTKVFHAGTRSREGRTTTAGGRVLCVCALGDDVGTAQRLAYERVKTIGWANAYYRDDIAYRAIARGR